MRKTVVVAVVASVLCMSLGLLLGYFIGKNQSAESANEKVTSSSSAGLTRSDEEKKLYYKSVFQEMKAENIRSNLK